jgi:hypothetical protein
MNLLARNDGVGLLRFYTMTPEAMIEVCRIATSVSHLRKIGEAISTKVSDEALKELNAASKPENGDAK